MEQPGQHDKKRLLKVTAANIAHRHVYITGHFDFFPPDCIGQAKKSRNGASPEIEIVLDGLNQTIRTDFGRDARTGKPRTHFRNRSWVSGFFTHHGVKAGDELALERLDERRYRLSVVRENSNGKIFRAAEFFAGIGLVRLALERQGWQVVFANDIDPDKAEMYRHNWPNSNDLVVEDIHKLKAKDIPDCDLYTASFPCNDLSIAGKWEGLSGKESSAFWGLIELLRAKGPKRPRLVLLENVLGFLMSNRGRDLEQALLALNELGYTVDIVVLNALHWVPQSRVRLFVIGKLNTGADRQAFALASDSRPPALIDFIAGHPNIEWDLLDLPPLPRPTKKLADIVEDLPDSDPHWWNEERTRYFFSQLSPRHKREAERMIEGRGFTFATAFRRVRHGKSMAELRTDGIAGCLRTPRGGSGRQILFKAGKGRYQVRLLTARECARLQGVPDSFVINVPLNQALFGFGDAVCVPAVEWIIKHYFSLSWYVKSVD